MRAGTTGMMRLLGRVPKHWVAFGVVFGVHLAVALFYHLVLGVDIIADPAKDNWDWFWQTLPMGALRSDLWGSLWNLHAQPPLYNLYGALFIRLFHLRCFEAMHVANMLLGGLLSAMLYGLLYRVTRSRRFSLAVALLLALHPSLFLYEAYLLYSLLGAFLVVLGVFLLSRFASGRRRLYLVLFILALNLLVLTRSLYHPVILLAGVLLVALLAGKEWRKVLLMSLLISGLSVGWCVKNEIKFGFFGTSSWGGLSLWKITNANYTKQDRVAWVHQGLVDATVVLVPVYSWPYDYSWYGFTEMSDVPVLARNDYNNINVIAISKLYGRGAWRVIRHDPGHYLRNVFEAYVLFSQPSSGYEGVARNARKIRSHEALSSQVLQGRWVARLFEKAWGRDSFGSFAFFLLPGSLLLYAGMFLRRCGLSWRRWLALLRMEGDLVFSAFLIFYTTGVSCLTELGENERFKFLIEPLAWAFLACVLWRLIRRFSQGRRWADRLRIRG